MSTDPDGPVVLVSVGNEMEAAMLTSVLADHGIEAFTTGGYTAGFRAEAPGDVKVLVRRADLEQAQAALAESRGSMIDGTNTDTD